MIGWRGGRYNKHGWNQYGPGYFELDEKTGILKSQGGMGLFWYSRKTYRDFILELDFKCSRQTTNSGIFLRVPALPASDDYIYHSFEVRIYHEGEGIHKTGAIYDAEPRGKIVDFSKKGYIGLQNHDSEFPVYFRNLFIKES